MKRADIKLGFTCNNNCEHCVVADKRNFQDKKIKEVETEIRESKKEECDEIVLTGGEPTIRKDIFEIISYAKKIGFQNIQIQTNGRMFGYEKFCAEVVRAGATDFVIGFHGYVAEQHDYITGSKGSFVQTIAGIKNLKSLQQRVAINVVVSKPNYRNLPEIAKLLGKLKVDQFQFAFVHPLGNAYKNFHSVVPRMTLIEPYIKRGLDIGIAMGVRIMTEAIPYCFMSGYEIYIGEQFIPLTSIFDINTFIANFTEQRINDGKKKSPCCQSCKYYKICEGPWREYPEKFGWDEFKPVEN